MKEFSVYIHIVNDPNVTDPSFHIFMNCVIDIIAFFR